MKVLSLFSGIGAFEKALDKLEVPYDLVAYCEIDKYASKSYSEIHNVPESMNLGDITKIDEKALPKNIDLVTYGFPCQDISLAGKQKGLFNEDGTQTRSGLFFEALRIIEETQPKAAIAENVKNLTSKKFSQQFKIVLDSLEEAGYNNYWQVLNAKDYGIPQNRERVFIVSIRKDIDTEIFQFPKGFPLELRLKDMLEDVVDRKFYISNSNVEKILKQHGEINEDAIIGGMQKNQSVKKDGIVTTLTSSMGTGGGYVPMVINPLKDKTTIQRIDIPQTVKVRKYPVDTNALCDFLRLAKVNADLTNDNIANALDVPKTKVEHWFRKDDCFAIPDADIWMKLKPLLKIKTDEFDESIMTFEEKEGVYEKTERHYLADGIAPTLTSTSGNEKIIVNEPKIECIGNIYPSGGQNGNVYDENGISPTLLSGETSTKGNGGIGSSNAPKILQNNLRIRKLTPKECFRLMGFSDSDFEKAETVNSNTQLYKQAGNSIVVDVLVYIIREVFDSGVFDGKIKKESSIKNENEQFEFSDTESFDRYLKSYSNRRTT